MTHKEVPLAALVPDTRNPRFFIDARPESNREAYRKIAADDSGKFITQAKHISEHGLNYAALMVVLPKGDGSGDYVVKDGNRRLAALRGLETPGLFDDVISSTQMAQLRVASQGFKAGPIPKTLLTAVAKDEQEARFWMKLIHRGEAGGAGQVNWDGRQSAQFDEEEGELSAPLQVLRVVAEHGDVPDDVREALPRFPVTTLERLLKTPEFRQAIGVELRGGRITTRSDISEVMLALTRVVVDLSSKKKTVTDLKRRDARIAYAKEVRPKGPPSVVADVSRPLDEALRDSPKPKRTRRKRASAETSRQHLIPRGCKLTIDDKRTAKLFEEIRRLKPERDPNTCAIMLRVAIEWTVQAYYQDKGLKPPSARNDKLRGRLTAVVADLVAAGAITKKESQAIRTEANRKNGVMAIETIQAYVHNEKLHPRPSDLIIAWDHYQPLFQGVWK